MPTWLEDGKTHVGGKEGLKELKEIAQSLEDPWKSSILWIPDDTDVSCNSVSYWITSPWDNKQGTITLAGDAAHPLPPRMNRQSSSNPIANMHRPRPGTEPLHL